MSESPNPSDEPATPDVLVVGGAGFLGSHLVERLLAAALAVDVVDDLSTGSLANLASARETSRINGGALRIHTLDATTPDFATLVAMRRPRQIYHLGLLAPRVTDPTIVARGFASTLAVLEAARQAGIGKVVVTLPATAMYGHPSSKSLPLREGTIDPRGVRGVVAKAVVDLLGHYRETHGIEFTALAIGSAYGPRQQPTRGVVAALVQANAVGDPARLTGDGRQSRDFVYIDDVVDALVRSRERGSGLVVNVGTGVATSLRDLSALVAKAGPDPTFVTGRPDELARLSLSPVRARIHLGWVPWTSLADGLAATKNPPTD